jgi:methionine aminopeptidase
VKTRYKGYTIVTETAKHPIGGWTLTLGIVAPDSGPVVAGINFGTEMTFATEALAHRGGVLLARYWIDGRDPE